MNEDLILMILERYEVPIEKYALGIMKEGAYCLLDEDGEYKVVYKKGISAWMESHGSEFSSALFCFFRVVTGSGVKAGEMYRCYLEGKVS